MRKTESTILSQVARFSQRMQTSLGWIRAISDGQHLIYLDWNQTGWTGHDQPDDVSRETIIQLTAYFHSDLRSLDLPLLPAGMSQSRRRWPPKSGTRGRHRLCRQPYTDYLSMSSGIAHRWSAWQLRRRQSTATNTSG